MSYENTIHQAAYVCLMEAHPSQKAACVRRVQQAFATGALPLQDADDIQPVPDPGRPPRPVLVDRRHLATRGLGSLEGRLALAHALAHIEFNAINIGLDAVYRFRDMPREFYADWLQVAFEEAEHFELLRAYLNEHGKDYGDYPAHDDLWEMVRRTDDDVLLRMALVPRVLEARGLDVTPGLQRRLRAVGENRLVEILDVIYREEMGHVRIGTHWFRHLCAERGLDARGTFRELLNQYMSGRIRGPYDELGRMHAGFTEEEMDDLRAMEKETLGLLA
ncbi:MAG TPA: ferritin-like domain-containing protein [bacterium]|nr:ferritin-like domain-containing protein [bacterium]